MSFRRYLKDNCRLLFFYALLMIFILGTTCLDRSNRMLKSNVTYMFFVSFIMFVAFLLLDYFMKNSYIKGLEIIGASKDKTPILPKPTEHKDEAYGKIISDIYSFYEESLRNIENEFKENNEFVISWVHEIKTPITTSKLLVESSDIDENGLLSSIKEEIDKIDDYVEEVLFYSRSDNFSQDYIVSEVALNWVVKESVKRHSTIFIKKHIKFVNQLEDKFLVDTDKKWILFIINQIVSNALKYTNNEGTIKFSSIQSNTESTLVIEDNGSGIKKEDMGRLFTKCFTGSNGRNCNAKSTGFGLYLSQKLAKKLGHNITIDSEYGKGTTVYIHFPKWNDYYNV